VPVTPEALVEDYLSRMVEIRGTGGATNETSYYGALETLLNAVGKTLKPRVICNGQLRSQGAGHPDFGLDAQTQCRSGTPREGQGEIPERDVVEVKGLAEPVLAIADTDQVSRYATGSSSLLTTVSSCSWAWTRAGYLCGWRPSR
jgi:hypothetical protein